MELNIFFWLKTGFCIIQYIMFFAAMKILMPIRCKGRWYWVWAVATNIATMLFSIFLPASSAIRAFISFIPILIAILLLTKGSIGSKIMMYLSIFLVMLFSEVALMPLVKGREADPMTGIYTDNLYEYCADMLLYLIVTAVLLGLVIIAWRWARKESIGGLTAKETLLAAGVPASQVFMLLFWLNFATMKKFSLFDSMTFLISVLICILVDFGVAYIFRSLSERAALKARTEMLSEQLSSKTEYCNELRRQLISISESTKNSGEKQTVTVIIRGSATVLPIENILYLERDRYKTNVITTDSMLTTTQSPADLLEKISERQFIHSHQSYWVNRNFISEMEKDAFVLISGIRIPISRSCKAAAKEKYLNSQ